VPKPNLNNLSREQKLELIKLLEEKKRLKKLNRPSYTPNAGQAEVHKSKALQRFVFSGNGAGKSTLLVHEMMWAAQGYNPITEEYTPVPAKIYVVLDLPKKIDEVILPELKKWFLIDEKQLEKQGKPYVSRITFKNGSFISFLFHEMSDLAAEGIECDWAIFDEPCPRHLYIALRRGGRTKGRPGRILFCGTPLAAPWLRKEIYEPWAKGELENVECFRFFTEVNKDNLREGYIEDFSKSLTEKEKAVRLRGDFFDLDGNAFGDVLQPDVHFVEDFDWNPEWPVVVAIDPHQSKPHHAVMVGVNPENHAFALKELKLRGPAAQFARNLHDWMDGYRVIDIVCDSLGNTPQTGGEGFLSFIQVLRKEGIMVRATTYDEKSEEDWIDRIKTALAVSKETDNFGQRVPKLRVFRSCRGLRQDLETVQWLKVKNEDTYKPKLDISNKDFLACLKYALATNLTIDKPEKKLHDRQQVVTTYGYRPTKWQKWKADMFRQRKNGGWQDND